MTNIPHAELRPGAIVVVQTRRKAVDGRVRGFLSQSEDIVVVDCFDGKTRTVLTKNLIRLKLRALSPKPSVLTLEGGTKST